MRRPSPPVLLHQRRFLGFELLLRGFEFVSEDSEIFGLLREFVDLMLGVFIWLAETWRK